MTMQKWQSVRVRTPYESPEAEVLAVGFEKQFLLGTNGYNSDNNGRPVDGDIVDLGD